MRREWVMLAEKFEEGTDVAGWSWSEKLDGQRAIWDGGNNRGAPWCNPSDLQVEPTGLWSRYGRVIHAPDWWLKDLPPGVLLDMELWMGRGKFQELRSVVSKVIPDSRWEKVESKWIDAPEWRAFLTPGTLRDPRTRAEVILDGSWEPEEFRTADPGDPRWIKQTLLKEDVRTKCREIVFSGGEGLILRKPGMTWTPKRVPWLLKVKPMLEGKGRVVGVTQGQGRLTGLIGALVVSWNGKQFELAGLTDEERSLQWVGKVVEFEYTSLTDSGLPREARFSSLLKDA